MWQVRCKTGELKGSRLGQGMERKNEDKAITPFSHLCNRANRDVMSSRYADFISSLRKEAWMRVSHFGKTF